MVYDASSDLSAFIMKATLSEITKQGYIERIRQLEKILDKPLFTIIKDAAASIKRIQSVYKVNTSLKSYLSVILSLFRHVPGLKEQLAKPYEAWSEAFKAADKAVEDRYKQNAPTERQEQGYLPWAEIVAKHATLKKGTEDRLLLGMYTLIYPLRADFNKVRLYTVVPKAPEANYIHMRKASCKLSLSEYKTSTKHGVFEKELPTPLCQDIRDSLGSRPRDYLFVMTNGAPYDKSKSFIHYANRAFERIFDRPLTISLLRHSFISSLDFNTLTVAEKEAIAGEMLHTTRLQDQYRLIFAGSPQLKSAL